MYPQASKHASVSYRVSQQELVAFAKHREISSGMETQSTGLPLESGVGFTVKSGSILVHAAYCVCVLSVLFSCTTIQFGNDSKFPVEEMKCSIGPTSCRALVAESWSVTCVMTS